MTGPYVESVYVFDMAAQCDPAGNGYSWYRGLLIPYRRSQDTRFRLQYLEACSQDEVVASHGAHLLVLGESNTPPSNTLNYARIIEENDNPDDCVHCCIEGTLDFPLNLTVGGKLPARLIPYVTLWVHTSEPQSNAAVLIEVSSDSGLSYLEAEAGRGPALSVLR